MRFTMVYPPSFSLCLWGLPLFQCTLLPELRLIVSYPKNTSTTISIPLPCLPFRRRQEQTIALRQALARAVAAAVGWIPEIKKPDHTLSAQVKDYILGLQWFSLCPGPLVVRKNIILRRNKIPCSLHGSRLPCWSPPEEHERRK